MIKKDSMILWLLTCSLSQILVSSQYALCSDANAQENSKIRQTVNRLTDDIIAVVNNEKISTKEYRSEYKRVVESYRDLYRDGFNDELVMKLDIKNKVIKDIIKKRLWAKEAQKRGLKITDDELHATIMQMVMFRKAGEFDRSLYESILILNNMNAMDFEEAQRRELLIEKMKQVVRNRVVVTDEEVDKFLNAESTDNQMEAEMPEKARQSRKRFLQFQKEEKAVIEYEEEMYKKANIVINEKAL